MRRGIGPYPEERMILIFMITNEFGAHQQLLMEMQTGFHSHGVINLFNYVTLYNSFFARDKKGRESEIYFPHYTNEFVYERFRYSTMYTKNMVACTSIDRRRRM